jgi:hypothetical protein
MCCYYLGQVTIKYLYQSLQDFAGIFCEICKKKCLMLLGNSDILHGNMQCFCQIHREKALTVNVRWWKLQALCLYCGDGSVLCDNIAMILLFYAPVPSQWAGVQAS